MDYRIFNVRAWLFLGVRVHTGGGGLGTPIASQHNISFWLGKTLTKLLLTQAGFEPPICGSRIRRSTHWATPSLPTRNLVHQGTPTLDKRLLLLLLSLTSSLVLYQCGWRGYKRSIHVNYGCSFIVKLTYRSKVTFWKGLHLHCVHSKLARANKTTTPTPNRHIRILVCTRSSVGREFGSVPQPVKPTLGQITTPTTSGGASDF